MTQIAASAQGAHGGGGLVESLDRRTKDIPGDWARAPAPSRTGPVAPALDRQLAELRAQRAPRDAGRRHVGAARRRRILSWALRASTTTDMTPDEIHQLGLDKLAELHGADGPDPARARLYQGLGRRSA